MVDSAKDDTATSAELWLKCKNKITLEKLSRADFDEKHAAFLRYTACNATDGREAIVKGVVHNWILGYRDRPAFSALLARGLLDGKSCAATKDLDEGDIEKLRAAIAEAELTP
jgi:hypothetical protein